MTQTTSHPTALISGGTSGIGHASARLLQEQGFSVLVTGQNAETIAAAERTLPQAVVMLRADARSLSDADRVAEEVKQRFSRLDFVFFNADIGRMLPPEAVDEAAFDDHFNITVKGQYFHLQKIVPLLVEGASVVFTTAVGPTGACPPGPPIARAGGGDFWAGSGAGRRSRAARRAGQCRPAGTDRHARFHQARTAR